MKKLCRTCRKMKQRESFHARKDARDGLQNYCKECARAYRVSRGKRGVKYAPKNVPVEALYVKVPAETKERVARYSEARNTSMSRSAAALLELALNMVERELERQGRELPHENIKPRSKS